MLLGRGEECRRLEGLLEEARKGRSGALVIKGEAGVGKTALLRYAAARASGMLMLRARGLESESELPYFGLADLVRPIGPLRASLPPVQAAALEGAFALGPPSAIDRFAIYAATLSLLSTAAEAQPLIAIVDDAHWLDASSLEALLFAARRLLAEGIALLLAVRAGEPEPVDIGDLPILKVDGLALDDSRRLLARGHEGSIADSVAELLHQATQGNPLALLEISQTLKPTQLMGTEPLPDPLPAGPTVQRAFNRRVARLNREAQRALLVAAASQSGASDVILRALGKMGLSPGALEEAELDDLVVLEKGAVSFRHPLLRSAVYHSAPPPLRRIAHGALADSLDTEADLHQRAWHLAAATIGHDDTVASLLEEAAADARSRAGYSAAATALERAAELTSTADEQARRLLASADAARLGGQPERAMKLLERASALAKAPVIRGDIEALRGEIELWHGLPQAAIDRLTGAAAAVEAFDTARAARMLVNATSACYMTADIDRAFLIGGRAHELGRRVGGSTEMLTGMGLAGVLMLKGEANQSLAYIERGLSVIGQAPPQDAFELHRLAGYVLLNIEDFMRARSMLDWMLETGRRLSAPAMLPYPLAALSEVEFRTGRWDAAYARASEAVRLGRETGQLGPSAYGLVCLARVEAGRGWEADCRSHVTEALDTACRLGLDSIRDYAAAAIGLLELGCGRTGAAIKSLELCAAMGRAHGLREPSVVQWAPDFIEACIRESRLDTAGDELAEFVSQAEQTKRAWALASAARCRGLFPGVQDYEDHFRQALSWHEQTDMPFEQARTELAYGESLRRHGRRAEARKPLASSLQTFEKLGSHPWAARARAELSATGMRVRRATIPASHQLTPQELQVALAVARGATNREAAAQLFLSLKTIEAHLTSTYSKLGLRSRSQLAALFAREAPIRRQEAMAGALPMSTVTS